MAQVSYCGTGKLVRHRWASTAQVSYHSTGELPQHRWGSPALPHCPPGTAENRNTTPLDSLGLIANADFPNRYRITSLSCESWHHIYIWMGCARRCGSHRARPRLFNLALLLSCGCSQRHQFWPRGSSPSMQERSSAFFWETGQSKKKNGNICILRGINNMKKRGWFSVWLQVDSHCNVKTSLSWTAAGI